MQISVSVLQALCLNSPPCVSSGPRYVVQIGEKVVDYNEEFRLFLATRNPSPVIPPDAASIITEVNFTTTRAGLRGQVNPPFPLPQCGVLIINNYIMLTE